jgi:hypothetical protein
LRTLPYANEEEYFASKRENGDGVGMGFAFELQAGRCVPGIRVCVPVSLVDYDVGEALGRFMDKGLSGMEGMVYVLSHLFLERR